MVVETGHGLAPQPKGTLMPTRDDPWPAGTPNWIDLGVDDLPTARSFYADLFGWQFEEGPPETRGYLMALKDGRAVAGLAPKMAPNQHTYWNNYLASDDVDASAGKITAAGGSLIVEPMDVMESGRMLVATDPNGAAFSVWQAKDHIGAGIFNEPGTYLWNENLSTDTARAKSFYAEVFGYGYLPFGEPTSAAGPYDVILRSGGTGMADAIGGVGDSAQAGGGNFWLVWFAVDDTDEAAAQVQRSGGRVITAPIDSPVGRTAMVQGTGGELFGIMKPQPPSA